MADEILQRDQNHIVVLGAITDDAAGEIRMLRVDPTTGALLISAPGLGTGTVTSVSVVTANGVSGSVATATTTPAITITLGAITPTSVNGLTITANGTNTLNIAAGKTLTILKSISFTAADDTGVYTLPTGTKTLVATDVATLSSLTSIGTIGTGVWQGTKIAVAYGGTNLTSISALSILIANSANVFAELTVGAGQSIRVNAGATAWEVFTPSAAVPTTITVANEATDTTCFIAFFTAATGDLGPKTNTNLIFNSNTNALALTGAFTATTLNGLTITANGTNTLNISAGKTVVHSAGTTFAGTDGKTLTISNSGTLGGGDAFVLAIAAAKTFTVSNTITLAGTDSTVMTFPSTSATIARIDAGQTFTGVSNITSWNFTTVVLGTPSSGTLTNCTGLPAASIVPGTLVAGAYILAENASIQLDPAGSADGKYTGITMTATSDYTQAFGDLVYLKSSNSRWAAADADAATTADVMLAMVVVTGTSGNPCTLLLQGQIRADAKFPALTIGGPVYVGEAAGEIQVAIPTGADNVIKRVGFALTADEIYFCPSTDAQTTVA